MQKTYFKNLDATRAIAFFLVFLGHMFFFYDVTEGSRYDVYFQFFKVGRFGVDYFFVLSGFLISWPWLSSKNNFSYKNFLVRRVLRIWPLYFTLVSIGLLVFSLSKWYNYPLHEIPSIFVFLSFTSNLFSSFYGADFLFFLVILWSVAIEFQFYIVWGLVIKFFKKYMLYVCLFFIFISLIFNFHFSNLKDTQDLIYFHTLSSIGNFGIGSLVAISAMNNGNLFRYFISFSLAIRSVIYLAIIFCIFFHSIIFNNVFLASIERFVFALMFGYVIIDQCFNSKPSFKLGDIKPLTFLGKISYGLYCYHALVITALIYLLKTWEISQSIYATLFVYPVLVIFLTVIISNFSFKYLEKRFLKLKNKFY